MPNLNLTDVEFALLGLVNKFALNAIKLLLNKEKSPPMVFLSISDLQKKVLTMHDELGTGSNIDQLEKLFNVDGLLNKLLDLTIANEMNSAEQLISSKSPSPLPSPFPSPVQASPVPTESDPLSTVLKMLEQKGLKATIVKPGDNLEELFKNGPPKPVDSPVKSIMDLLKDPNEALPPPTQIGAGHNPLDGIGSLLNLIQNLTKDPTPPKKDGWNTKIDDLLN